MRSISVAPLAAAALVMAGASSGTAFADQGMRISGPLVHANLAVYFVHGTSASGPVPLTRQEALAKGSVQVIETGQVTNCRSRIPAPSRCSSRPAISSRAASKDRVLR